MDTETVAEGLEKNIFAYWGLCDKIISDKCLQMIVTKCTKLTHLNISLSSNISDIAVYAIADHCRLLCTLKLRGCSRVTHKGIVYISKKCTDLKHIDISGINNVSDASMFAIADHCKNLTSLNIQDCCKVSQEGIKYVIEKGSTIQSLHLHRSQIDNLFRCNRLTGSNTFQYLCGVYPNLKINKIVDCDQKYAYSIEK